ncbi:MAG TPA: ADP-glyceromanno-heptose 6-epimerase [Bacteroidota bacterium]|nr:ADP-glyceromanno-heptose 6-epimerase [Bacteroidota bacterium]
MIVVTGGAGFIGSAMIAKLNEKGREDILVVDALASTEKWKNLVGKKFADYMHKDVFLKALDGGTFPHGEFDAIIHLGACSSTTERNVDYLMQNNYYYTKRLADYATWSDVRFIYASSAATYGNGEHGFSDDDAVTPLLKPLNPYGYSKQIFDLWSMRNGLTSQTAGIKFFNVFGPNEYHKGEMKSLIAKAYRQIMDTGKVRLFKSHRDDYRDGEQVRDFIYVKDCTETLWWLLEHKDVNGIFNLGTGKARSWNDLANAIFSALGRPAQIEYIDMPESIRNAYQYHTEAEMTKLASKGFTQQFSALEDSVHDYVVNYLHPGELHL